MHASEKLNVYFFDFVEQFLHSLSIQVFIKIILDADPLLKGNRECELEVTVCICVYTCCIYNIYIYIYIYIYTLVYMGILYLECTLALRVRVRVRIPPRVVSGD
jgi:hypothetical protein